MFSWLVNLTHAWLLSAWGEPWRQSLLVNYYLWGCPVTGHLRRPLGTSLNCERHLCGVITDARYLEFKDETQYPGPTPRVLFSSYSVHKFKAKHTALKNYQFVLYFGDIQPAPKCHFTYRHIMPLVK